MIPNGCIGRLVHGGHAWAVVLPWKPIDVDFQLDRSDGWVEVEESILDTCEGEEQSKSVHTKDPMTIPKAWTEGGPASYSPLGETLEGAGYLQCMQSTDQSMPIVSHHQSKSLTITRACI